MKQISELYNGATELLEKLVSTPSLSREEDGTASLLTGFLSASGVADVRREGNNVWAYNRFYDASKPTILLNSHHDTVKPAPGYSRDPFVPVHKNGKLYGLGTNDAGASVVSLVAMFLYYYENETLAYNLCIALTAEEEISGSGGIESILPLLGPLEFAIVGEPTGMQMAIGERGLLVLDCIARGVAGHAARNEGVNAIYQALEDIEWFRTFRFPRKSELFGDVKMSVTVIGSGSQHNVVPSECRFTVDVRVTDRYTLEEVLQTVRENVKCEVTPRSVRLKPSYIAPTHPLVTSGKKLGLTTYGSPTTSDQALLDIPSLKIGPGDSARSHTADEYIVPGEIAAGIETYIALVAPLLRGGECI